MLTNDSCLDELQETEFKRTVINIIQELKEYKGNTEKQLDKIKERELKKE